jgi:5-methyltetrahydrofolate--homocysteine methyltransferase
MTDDQAKRLICIGENVHTTRVVLRKGKRFHAEEGKEAVHFTSVDGDDLLLPVPEKMKKTQDYEEGRVKHVQIAINLAMAGGADADLGMAYLRRLVHDQEQAGARYLDVNVDEISIREAEREAAMDWTVRAVQSLSALPVAVDSSSVDVLRVGLEAWDRSGGRAMLNSASLERQDALDLAIAHNAEVVVTAAGETGMPDGPDQRIENAGRMIEMALAKGIVADDIYVDPLYFPVAVDVINGQHGLDAIRGIRERYGPEIHITGGISNVSFGIPARRIINDVFLILAMDAGADSGIFDPVLCPPDKIRTIDRTCDTYRIAEDVILGRDKNCRTYIRTWRKGELTPWQNAA